MRKRLRLLSLLMLVTSLLGIGLTACSAQQATVEQEKVIVSRGDVAVTINADGELSIPLDRKLSFGTSGTIEQVNVADGDKVTKGEVLAKLDTTPLQRAVDSAELAVKSAQIDLEQAQGNVQTATIDLETATDAYRKITYPYTYSTFAFDVPKASDFISSALQQISDAQNSLQAGLTAEQYKQVSDKLKQAQQNLADAQQQLDHGQGPDLFSSEQLQVKDFWTLRATQLQMEKAQAALTIAQNAVDKARLGVEKAQYDRDTAKDLLDKAAITAPFDGIAAIVNIKVGDTLTQVDFTKVAIEVIDQRKMEQTIKVDERDISQIKLSQNAIISIDALADTKLDGKVINISSLPTIESGVILYKVKISFDVPDGTVLKQGMSSSADIIINQHDGVLKVPNRAVTENSAGKSVVKVLANNITQEREVVTGLSNNLDTEIASGLNEGDTIVIERVIKSSSSSLFGG